MRCSRVDPLGEADAARSWTFRQTAHSTIAAIHRDASTAEIGQLRKVVCCPPSVAQWSQTALSKFEICRSGKADPCGQAAPARRNWVALHLRERERLRALEAEKTAR